MLKPLIVMALESEGQGKLEAIGYDVIYCGVGKVNATYHLTRRLYEAKMAGKNYPLVLSVGSAGSPTFKRGELVASNEFVQRDMDCTGLGFAMGHTPFEEDSPIIIFPKIFDELPHGICGSGDSFLQGLAPIPCDVIEMEAYGLAKVCLRENIAFGCLKYITDGADEGASNDWNENLKHAADAFTNFLRARY